jgi:hypothetical protein
MTDVEILRWLQRVATATVHTIEDGEPIYIERVIAALQVEIEDKETP